MSHTSESERGFRAALRHLRDPLLPSLRTHDGHALGIRISRRAASVAPGAGSARLLYTAVATSLVLLSCLGAVSIAQHFETVVGNFADFYGNIWWAGHRILDGKAAVPDGQTAWPPTATVFVAPLTLLPYWVALAAWTAISVGAFVVALRLAGCRDRRALLVAALSPPALGSVVAGNISLVLAAGVAIVWASRDRAYVSGFTAGAVVAAKIWLWPILIFFVLTRRWVSLAAALGWCVAGAAIWLVLSPATIRAFPAWSDQMVETYAQWGMGLSTTIENLGVSVTGASAFALGAGLIVLVATARARNELTILAGCVAAALVAAPLVWQHYYAVLFVPIAALAPRLSALWFVPYLTGFVFLWPSTPTEFIGCSLGALAGTALVTGIVAKRMSKPAGGGALATG